MFSFQCACVSCIAVACVCCLDFKVYAPRNVISTPIALRICFESATMMRNAEDELGVSDEESGRSDSKGGVKVPTKLVSKGGKLKKPTSDKFARGQRRCRGCRKNKKAGDLSTWQALCLVCKKVRDCVYNHCKCQGQLEWFQTTEPDEDKFPQLLSVHDKMNPVCKDIGQRAKGKFSVLLEKEIYECTIDVIRDSVGRMMTNDEFVFRLQVHFKMSALKLLLHGNAESGTLITKCMTRRARSCDSEWKLMTLSFSETI